MSSLANNRNPIPTFRRGEYCREWLGGPLWSPVGRGGAFFTPFEMQTFTDDPQSTTKDSPTNTPYYPHRPSAIHRSYLSALQQSPVIRERQRRITSSGASIPSQPS